MEDYSRNFLYEKYASSILARLNFGNKFDLLPKLS